MRVILYKSKHGSTRKIAKVINEYIGDCLLMSINDIDEDVLLKAQVVIIGTPVYYGKLDSDIVSFIKEHQELLISKKYCLYVVGILQSEFMSYVTQAFDYHILKDIQVIAGLGGALYYPTLSISEKMILQVIGKRLSILKKDKSDDIFENFNNEEIEIFANKIKNL
jgi:Flavodoxin